MQRTYNMLQIEKKNRRKDKAVIKEFEALKREHLKTLDIRLVDIKDEQISKRNAQRDLRIERSTNEELQKEYNKIVQKLATKDD